MPLILLDRQNVIRLVFNDLGTIHLLIVHRVDSHDEPGQLECVQQLGNGGDLVALAVHFALCQDQPVFTGPGADQMDGLFPEIGVKRMTQFFPFNGNHLPTSLLIDP